MPMRNLQEAFVEELQDLLHAERQLAKALPKMAEKASDPQLKQTFQDHIQQTEEQIQRIEQAFGSIGEEVKAKKCEGMQGILEEGEELMNGNVKPEVLNALLAAAAQKAEHYEIASYGTVCSWAELLEYREVAKLLRRSLDEEKETDERLTMLAESSLNQQARSG